MNTLRILPNQARQLSNIPQIDQLGVSDPASPEWLLSFNDLLTLLLCFFLTLLSKGYVQKSNNEKKPSERNEIGAEQKARLKNTTAGTRFATFEIGNAPLGIFEEAISPTSGQRELIMRFRTRDYPREGAALKESAVKRLKLGLKFGVLDRGYEVDQALVETCFDGLQESSQGYYWHVASERALSLGRQVVDAGVKGSTLRLRALGSNCQIVKDKDNGRFRHAEQGRGALVSRIVMTLKAEDGR